MATAHTARAIRAESLQLARDQLDLSRREVRVDRVLGAPLEPPAYGEHELGADLLCAGMGLGSAVRLEHDLSDARPIAQVDEDHPAVVTPPTHPAAEDDLLAHVLRAQLTTEVRAAQISQGVESLQGALRLDGPGQRGPGRRPGGYQPPRRAIVQNYSKNLHN